MSTSSRRGFVTGTIAAGAAALTAAPSMAGNSNAGFQGGAKEKLKFVVEVGNIGGGTVEEAIAYAQKLQIPAISVPWVRVPGFQENGFLDGDKLKAVRAQIEQAGLLFHSMQGSIPRPALTGGAEGEKAFVSLRKTFQAMGAAKADLLMGFVPAPQNAPWEQVVTLYRNLMKEMEPAGIRLASHTYQAINNWATMSKLIKDVPSPNNGFTYCTGNVWHGEHENIYNIPSDVASRIWFLHIRNVKTGQGEKEFWFDQGDIDFPKLLASLRKIGYKGYMRSEHLPTDNYRLPKDQSDLGTAWVQGYMRAMQQLL